MTYEKECIVCGKTFITGDSRKIMCSRECQKLRQRYLQNELVGDYCEVCGKYFERTRISSRATCSTACAHKMRAKTVSEPKEPKKKKTKKKSSLEMLVQEASEKGISYGQLQAQKLMAEMRAAE